MYNETIRDIIYFIFPNKNLIEDAFQWDEERFNWADFPSDHPDQCRFNTIGEMNAVKAVYEALVELTGESLKLKLEACRRQPESYTKLNFGHVSHEIAPNDFVFWARKSIWNPQEAALLSLGFCPSEKVVCAFDDVDAKGYATCRLLREFSERAELIVSANRSGQLGADGDPLDLIQWFARMEYGLPEGLAETVVRIHSPERVEQPPVMQASQYSDREKETLLKLVAAMAIRGYSFNPALSRNPATKDIQSDLDYLGIGLDQKTILKWLREATKDLPDETQN